MAERAMRLLHVVASLDPLTGGPAVSVPATARAQASLGARVVVAAARRGAPAEWRQSRNPRLMSWRRETLRGFAGDADHAIRRTARWASVVHSHGLWMGCNTWARIEAQRNGLPLIVSPRGMLLEWSLGQGAFKKQAAMNLYERSNLEAAAVLHATSRAEVESFRQLGLHQPVALVPNGIALPSSIPKISRRGERRVALFLSRLHHKKGIEELLESWAKLAPENWELWIAGDGEEAYVARLRKIAGRSRAPVRFLGFLTDVPRERAFKAASLFILPTHSENFGLAVGEALGRGIPAITTTETAWHEIEEAQAGWIIPPGRREIDRVLPTALAMPETELRAMGARGRELIRTKYSWENASRSLLEVAEWLSGLRDVPDCVEVE